MTLYNQNDHISMKGTAPSAGDKSKLKEYRGRMAMSIFTQTRKCNGD